MRKKYKTGLVLALVAAVVGTFTGSVFSSAKEKDILAVGSSGIEIDGYYDDWVDFPDTDITYYSNNQRCVHAGNIYSDGDYLYVHVSMNELYTYQMQFHSFVLKVNDKEVAIPILGVHPDGSIDWEIPIYGKMPEGIHTNLAVFLGYYKACDSSVAFTVYDENHADDTKGDEIEFRISMEDITEYFGIEADSIDTISVRNPNIGGEAIIWAGSSTAPTAGAAAAFAFVACVAGVRQWKKKGKMME